MKNILNEIDKLKAEINESKPLDKHSLKQIKENSIRLFRILKPKLSNFTCQNEYPPGQAVRTGRAGSPNLD